MLSVALVSLMLAAVPAPGRAATAQSPADPAIRVSLDHRNYDRGDRARVTIRVRDDGYVIVLQQRADGLIRVLFPLDPGEDNFVRGGQDYEVRGRGDRRAFTVESARGTGTIYAAWSPMPYNFSGIVRGDHWDYGAIGDSALDRDPESGFTNIVQRLATGNFQYDLQSYGVREYVASTRTVYMTPYYDDCWSGWYGPGCYGYGYGFGYGYGYGFRFGWGLPIYASSCFDPFFYGFGPCGFRYAYGPYGYYSPYAFPPYGYYYRRPIVIAAVPFQPYYWKPGGFGGGGVLGAPYRPRGAAFGSPTVFRPARSPLFASSQFARSIPVRERTAGSAVGVGSGLWNAGFARRPAGATTNVPERVPMRVRGTEPAGVPARGFESMPRRRSGAEPSVGAPELTRPRGTPAGVIEPHSILPRTTAPEINAPRGTPARSAEPNTTAPEIVRPRGTPARSIEPRAMAPDMSGPRGTPARSIEPRGEPSPRAEAPRYSPPPRSAEPRYSPPPRVEAPRSSPPPRVEMPRSSPPPRVEAPRYSPPPRSEAPRSAPSEGGGSRRRP